MDIQKVLIADDEKHIREILKMYCEKEGFDVIEAADGAEAILKVQSEKPDILILDIMMPVMDGLEVCKQVRKMSDLPIIMLTARGGENDELRGFELGVDEYIAKPFSPKILVARVEALLRRTNSANEKNLEYGGIVLNRSAHEVIIDGEKVDLSYKEFELLSYFMENKDIALSRERILNHVWDYDYFGDARTIDTHVKKLRSKMGEKGKYIKTIWGMGYKFEV